MSVVFFSVGHHTVYAKHEKHDILNTEIHYLSPKHYKDTSEID